MGQSRPFRTTALLVEDDAAHRSVICNLLQARDFDVIQCESGEAAERVIEKNGACISLLMTDFKLAGYMDGLELAQFARERAPTIAVIITSGEPRVRQLPNGVTLWAKPWAEGDILRTAQQVALGQGR